MSSAALGWPVRREVGLEGAARAEGLVVVIDVLRAFTTAAVALDAGAREVVLFDTVEGALAAKAREPDAFLMGEQGGASAMNDALARGGRLACVPGWHERPRSARPHRSRWRVLTRLAAGKCSSSLV